MVAACKRRSSILKPDEWVDLHLLVSWGLWFASCANTSQLSPEWLELAELSISLLPLVPGGAWSWLFSVLHMDASWSWVLSVPAQQKFRILLKGFSGEQTLVKTEYFSVFQNGFFFHLPAGSRRVYLWSLLWSPHRTPGGKVHRSQRALHDWVPRIL